MSLLESADYFDKNAGQRSLAAAMRSMPFYSQIVNWDNEDSGFPNQEAIREWEPNCCGIACLRMILAYYRRGNGDKRTRYWNLLQAGLTRGAYSEKGWIHQGLLEMAADFGIRGQCHRRTDVTHVVDSISRGSACIVSVTRYFLGGQKDGNGIPLSKGGHLVVAYDTIPDGQEVKAIVCNHPSSGKQWNMPSWAVALDKWERSFSGNYVEFFSGQGEPNRQQS